MRASTLGSALGASTWPLLSRPSSIVRTPGAPARSAPKGLFTTPMSRCFDHSTLAYNVYGTVGCACRRGAVRARSRYFSLSRCAGPGGPRRGGGEVRGEPPTADKSYSKRRTKLYHVCNCSKVIHRTMLVLYTVYSRIYIIDIIIKARSRPQMSTSTIHEADPDK